MTSFDTTEAWNAYIGRWGYEPENYSQLLKFSKSSAGKHVENLSFKQAQKVFKLNKGKGKIDANKPPKKARSKSRSRSKSPHRTPKKPHPLKKHASSSSSSTSQLSPPTKTKSKSNKVKKTSTTHKLKKNAFKKKQLKSNKMVKKPLPLKARQIRSTLYNNANDLSLDSMLEILRRATLVKKQKKLFEKEQLEQMAQMEKQMEAHSTDHDAAEPAWNDLTTTDLQTFRNQQHETRKETEQLFQTITSVDGSVTNFNPLLLHKNKNKYSIDEDSSDEDKFVVDGHVPGISLGALGVIDDDKEVDEDMDVVTEPEEEEEDEIGYETPPELFRDDNEWDWTENDIVFADGSLNYGISLQLLHLGLTQGPLFPNSILVWKRLQFNENGPSPRSGHIGALVHDKMVIFGGYCQQMLTDHIFLVDTSLFTDDLDGDDVKLEVTPISSLEKIHKTYRVGHCGVSLSHNNCLYLFGGWNDQKYINHGLLFNVDSLKLVVEQTKDRILPPPRRDHTLCKMGACLLLFGGWSHDYDGNELWLLGSNWKWKQLSVTGTAPCCRRGHSGNVIASHMYIFAGLYGFSKYLNDLHIYNGDTSEWIQPKLVGTHRPSPRAWHSANTIGSQILIFGGTKGRTNFLNDCWVFDTCGYFWFQIECYGQGFGLQLSQLPLPRCSHSMVKIVQDKEFMTDPFTNECIDIDKEGEFGDAAIREKRLAFIMFGGLVAKECVDNEEERKEEKNKNKESKKKKVKVKKKKKIKKKGSGLLGELKADISKQQKKESKVYNENGLTPINVSGEGLSDDNSASDMSDIFSSDSEQEADMDHVNRIELSDDLFALMLEI